MDKLTSINLSFDKILIQIIVPGLTAIFPYFLIFLNHHPQAKEYFYNNQSVTITTVTLLSLIAGMLLENFGGRFEISYLDKKVIAERFPAYKETWDSFLKLDYNNEPVGQRYLRNILMRMKFEISMGIAMIPLMAGLLVIQYQSPIFDNCIWVALLLVLLPFLLFLYLLFVEAPSSAYLLAETRELLVKKFKGDDSTKQQSNSNNEAEL